MSRIKQGFIRKKNRKRENKLWLTGKRLTDTLYHKASVSAVGRSLNDYVGEEKVLEKSFLMRKLKGLLGMIDIKRLKLIFQRNVEQSRILEWFSVMGQRLITAMIRQYGVFVFSLGLYTLLVYFIGFYTNASIEVSNMHLTTGALEILCAIPMLISKKTLCEALCESRLADLVLFKFFGLSTELFEKTRREESTAGPLPVIFGLLAGLATTVISPLTLLIAAVIAIMACITLVSPESALVALIAFMPYIPESCLRAFVWFIVLAYIIKVARGKRTFKPELTDYAVMILALIILLSSIVSLSPEISRRYSFVTITYMAVYFLIVNTVKTRPWIQRFSGAVIFLVVSSVLLGFGQKFISAFSFIFTEDIIVDGRVSAAFSDPNVFSRFIILFIFYLFAHNISTRPGVIRRSFMFILTVLSVLCLFYTDTPLAFCCFLIALWLFLLLYSKKTLIFTVLIAAALPFAKYIMPAFISKFINGYITGIKEELLNCVSVWRVSVNMVIERLVGGSGSGTYEYLYSQYDAGGHEAVSLSYNTYLQTAVETGIIGLIVFLVIVYLFVKCNLSLFAKQGAGIKNIDSVAGFSGIIGILLLANFENIWQDPYFILAFWVALGLCMAIKRHKLFVKRDYDEYLLKNI